MKNFLINNLHNFAAACSPKSGFTFLNFPTWYQYLPSENVAGRCTPKIDLFNSPDQLGLVGLAVLDMLLRIAGLVAVGFIIYGGYQYILSQGEPERAAAARTTILNAIIGLVIAISATVIVVFLASNLSK